MKVTAIAVMLCFIALRFASAAPLQLAPGLWKVTTLIRNFGISSDGQREVENGGSGPSVDQTCLKKHEFGVGDLYPGLKIPALALRCKLTPISETSSLIDSVVECSAYNDASPRISHTVVTAPTPKSFLYIYETTFLETEEDGGVSRSTMYRRGSWLKGSCDK